MRFEIANDLSLSSLTEIDARDVARDHETCSEQPVSSSRTTTTPAIIHCVELGTWKQEHGATVVIRPVAILLLQLLIELDAMTRGLERVAGLGELGRQVRDIETEEVSLHQRLHT